MKRITIAKVAIKHMRLAGFETIDIGLFGMLDYIYVECVKVGAIKKLINHPLDRQAYIMGQLRKSKLFILDGHAEFKGMGRAYSNCSILKINQS